MKIYNKLISIVLVCLLIVSTFAILPSTVSAATTSSGYYSPWEKDLSHQTARQGIWQALNFNPAEEYNRTTDQDAFKQENIYPSAAEKIVYPTPILTLTAPLVRNIDTGESFQSIQAAINDPDTRDGHTIEVYSGIYYENVNVTKRLILRGIDTGAGKPIVDGDSRRINVVTISVDGVTLEGFKVRNSGHLKRGIYVTSDNNIIRNNTVSNNWRGIHLLWSNNNILSNNNVSNNDWGIGIDYSNNNILSNNNVSNNHLCGIFLWDSNNNILSNNNALNNYGGIFLHRSNNNTFSNSTVSNNQDDSISLYRSNNNTLYNNNASNNWNGIYLDYSNNNTLSNNNASNNHMCGIYLSDSNNNTLYNNNASNNHRNDGIHLVRSNNNILSNNYVSNNIDGISLIGSNNNLSNNNASNNHWHGISLWSSNNNTLSNNNALNNRVYGISISFSNNNRIYLNNFINNKNNFYSIDSVDIWNSREKITYAYKGRQYTNYLGNYWSDYTGKDANNDGIGDAPYRIGGYRDYYPLMEPFENYLVESFLITIKITPPTVTLNVNTTQQFSATVLPAGANQSVLWSVTNVTGTGTINATGFFRAISAGTVNVIARSVIAPAITGTATVTVIDGVWQAPETLDSAGDVGEHTSIVICPAGNVHISYFDMTNGDLKYITRVGGVWQASETLDSVGWVGLWSSIAICPAGNVHISYHDWTNHDIKYITRVGGVWQAPKTIDSVGWVGAFTSIAICQAGNVHISYFDMTNGDLKYITRVGGVWQALKTLDGAGDVGRDTSISICQAGNVHISYFDMTNGDLKYITRVGGVWQASETLDIVGSVGGFTSISICQAGNVHISYYDWTNSDLKYITRVDGVWQASETIDSVGYVGGYTSIDICPAGNVHISYSDWTNSDLKYITRISGVWQSPKTIDSVGDIGFTSIAICPAGNVHISYHDWTNRDLKYATNARVEVAPAPTGITITPPTTRINVTEPQQFSATVLPAGANQNVLWSVHNITGTGTINATTGLFRAISAGTVIVTTRSATNPNITGNATVTVVAPVVPPALPVVTAGTSHNTFEARDGITQSALLGQDINIIGLMANSLVTFTGRAGVADGHHFTATATVIGNTTFDTIARGMRTGRYIVNATNTTNVPVSFDLFVDSPTLTLRVELAGTDTAITSVARGTHVEIDIATNINDSDRGDIRLTDPNGLALRANPADGALLRNLSFSAIDGPFRLNTVGWNFGTWTIEVRTVEEHAQGLDKKSAVVRLKIIEDDISIRVRDDTISVNEITAFTVTAPAGRWVNITVDTGRVVLIPNAGDIRGTIGVNDTRLRFRDNNSFDIRMRDGGTFVFALRFTGDGTFTVTANLKDVRKVDINITVGTQIQYNEFPAANITRSALLGQDIRITNLTPGSLVIFIGVGGAADGHHFVVTAIGTVADIDTIARGMRIGRYLVNATNITGAPVSFDLFVDSPILTLRVEVGDTAITSVARNTPVTIDITTNIHDSDIGDIRLTDPNGTEWIRTPVTNETLRSLTFATIDGRTINTAGWNIGTWRIEVRTVEARAQGLDKRSNVVDLRIVEEGDANDDGRIDITDFGILAASFMRREGEAGFDRKADFNGDGIVNIADFGILAANFGR